MEEALHFLMSAAGITVALLIVATLLWLARWLGWTGPLDIVAVLERWFGLKLPAPRRMLPVNVEFRDRDGVLMDLGSFVLVTLHNGRGDAFQLREGIFVGCDPSYIWAGVLVHISIQNGLVKEQLSVQLDLGRQQLFVCSNHLLAEVVLLINRRGDPPLAPAPRTT